MSDQNQSEENAAETAAETTPASIRLDQFLQLCGVPTGGQAKVLIQSGEVSVNGEVETRRRRKLVPGDSVGFDGEVFDVAAREE
jgi:ribosome-associated protein